MSEQPAMRVFGSYNSKDRQKVESVRLDLESWGITIWLDTELTPGTVFGRTLEAAIERADAAVIFIGAERGRWQELEIFSLLQRQVAGKLAALIPVLLEGAGPNAGGFLGNIEHVDFRSGDRQALRQLANALLAVRGGREIEGRGSEPRSKALLRWIAQEATKPTEVLRIIDLCVEASQWPEALFACKRLRSIALDSRDAVLFAKSYETTGRIYFLSDKPGLAESQWGIGLAIHRKYDDSGVEAYQHRIQSIRQDPRISSGRMQPASAQS